MFDDSKAFISRSLKFAAKLRTLAYTPDTPVARQFSDLVEKLVVSRKKAANQG